MKPKTDLVFKLQVNVKTDFQKKMSILDRHNDKTIYFAAAAKFTFEVVSSQNLQRKRGKK